MADTGAASDAPTPSAVPVAGSAPAGPAAPATTGRFDSPWWLLVLVPLFVTGLTRPLQSPDEPREAEIARGMFEGWDLPVTLDSQHQARAEGWTLPPLSPDQSPAGKHVDGSWVVPHLAGRPFLEKPPLYYWSVCGAFALFGVNEFAARLPNALYGLLSCLLMYALLRRWANAVTALATAALLATMHRFWEFSHTAMIDMALTFCVTGGYYVYARWQEAFFTLTPPSTPPTPTLSDHPSARAAAWPWALAFWSFIGLAFLAKNMVGPILILSGAGIHLLYAGWQSRRWLTGFLNLGLGLPMLLVLLAPWLSALYHQCGGQALYELLWLNTFGRFNSGYAGHRNDSLFYYIDNFFMFGAPWTLLLPAAALWLLTPPRLTVDAGSAPRLSLDRSRILLAFCWILVPTVVLSLSAGKRGLYLLPLLPGQAALLGLFLSRLHEFRPRAVRLIGYGLTAAICAIVIGGLLAALGFALAPQSLSAFYNSLPSRQTLPHMHFGGPIWFYLPFGLAAIALAVFASLYWVRQLRRAATAPPPTVTPFQLTALLGCIAAVGLFFLGVNLGGLFDFTEKHRSLGAFYAACSRADRGQLFLVFCGEKERGIIAWASRGHHLCEEPRGQDADPARGQPAISLADALQKKLDGPTERFVMVPESALDQLHREFPTWHRHLYPVEVVSVSDAWYWLLSTRLHLPNTVGGASLSAPDPAGRLRQLTHPTQTSSKLRIGEHDLQPIWGAEALLAQSTATPGWQLAVVDERNPGEEQQPLARIRAEWPVFDRHFQEIAVLPTGADLHTYTGDQPQTGPAVHFFVAREKPLASPAPQ